MALLDVVGVTASGTYKNLVLSGVFTQQNMELRVFLREIGGTADTGVETESVSFQLSSSESRVYIQGYDIAIPANSEVYRFGFREVSSPTSYTAFVDLDASEVLEFVEAGIMYINEIGFELSVSLG